MSQLTLSLSPGRENWRKVMWTEIYDRALQKGKIVNARVGNHKFRYALINSKDRYESITKSTTGEQYDYTGKTVSFWIKDEENSRATGFNYEGLPFVLERNVSDGRFQDLVGLHENVEARIRWKKSPTLELGENVSAIHVVACSTEIGEVLRYPQAFVERYAEWLVHLTKEYDNPERGYFGRSVPEMIPLILDGKLTPFELLREFKKRVDETRKAIVASIL